MSMLSVIETFSDKIRFRLYNEKHPLEQYFDIHFENNNLTHQKFNGVYRLQDIMKT